MWWSLPQSGFPGRIASEGSTMSSPLEKFRVGDKVTVPPFDGTTGRHAALSR